MLTAPPDLSTDDIRAALATGWGLGADTIVYRPVGFGSHHWAVDGNRWFATADVATPHLEPALQTAIALRAAGLEFVVAPVPTIQGTATQAAGARYLVSLYPHLDGESGDFGTHPPADRPAIRSMLARLHGTAAPAAEPLDLDLPARDGLRRARLTTGRGPYGVRSKALLTAQGDLIDALLAEYDRLRATALPSPDQWVVTHGEPHPGNIMRTPDGLRLVDWDTVRLAPAARDLWMVDDRPEYAFFNLRWRLTDLALAATDLSVPHTDTEDTSTIFGILRECLAYEGPLLS
jgi:spectinomycin phosphotransferase